MSYSSEKDVSTPTTVRGCGGIFFVIMLVFGACWGAGLGAFVWILEDAKSTIAALEDFRPKTGSKVYSWDGELLGSFTTEKRELLALNEIPLYLQKAVVATEDHLFYKHHGVRVDALVRVVLDSITRGRTRGASTLTMQTVRNVDPLGVGREHSVVRKLHEIVVALQVERAFTKDEILELYLNQVFWGISAYGVEEAAHQYFGISCRDITLGEAATLAGVLRYPNVNEPLHHTDNAKARRDIVLGQMCDTGFITSAERDAAIQEDLSEEILSDEKRDKLRAEKNSLFAQNKFKAPYLVEEVRQFILGKYGKDVVFEDGLDIQTTVDMRLQRAAEDTLLPALEEFDKKKRESLIKQKHEDEFIPVSGALVCIDNRPGYQGFVRAMVGGRDFDKEKFNTVTQARRQPGSSVKPYVWAAAIASGYTPSSIVVDEPFQRLDGAGKPWSPKNFSGSYGGPMTLRHALEQSVNVVSVKLVDKLGMPLVRSYMQRCGITTPIDDNVGLTIGLGSPDIYIIDQCVGYSSFANGGVRNDPVMITDIRNRDGVIRYDYTNFVRREQALDPKVAYVATHMMEGVCTPDPKRGYYPTGHRTAALGRPRAGKTGTTNHARNVWFCGFTPDFTCVVWLGYPDNRSLGAGKEITGGSLACPIWTKFMIAAEEGLPVREFEPPYGVSFFNVDRINGLAGGDFKEAFITGTQPPETWQPPLADPEAALLIDAL